MAVEAIMPRLSVLLLACCFATAVSAQTPEVLKPGVAYTPDTELICRTPEAFKRLVTDAAVREPLEAQVASLKLEVSELRQAEQNRKTEVDSLRVALEAKQREVDAFKSLSDSLTLRFNSVNDALTKAEKRGGPWIVSGPTLGVGYAQGQDGSDIAVFAGYGFTFNLGRRH
jgi:hypothetical protein